MVRSDEGLDTRRRALVVRLDRARRLAPGLVVTATIAIAATFLSEHYTAPVMVYALLIGMAFNFLGEQKGPALPGIEYASKTLLRLAVGLLGVQITFTDILHLGLTPVLAVILGVALTIGFGMLAARLLGVDRSLGILTSAAVAICGASAAMAISSVLPRGERLERDTVFTVIGVTTLSTLAMVLYPVLISAFDLDHAAIGLFLGGTIHDVAQVVGAGYSVSEETGNVATFTKLLRVAMLLPIVMTLALCFRSAGEGGKLLGRTFPSFLLLFAALVVASSLGLLPPWMVDVIKSASRWLLVAAIAALGMKTSLRSVMTVGGRAIALIVLETVFLAVFVLAIILWLHT